MVMDVWDFWCSAFYQFFEFLDNLHSRLHL